MKRYVAAELRRASRSRKSRVSDRRMLRHWYSGLTAVERRNVAARAKKLWLERIGGRAS